MDTEEFIMSLENETNPLSHMNKLRPKRTNVKRPTSKNPYAIIEIEFKNEDLIEKEPKCSSQDEINFTNPELGEKKYYLLKFKS